jgi:flagellar hook assembly protein FlgD
VDLGPAGYDIYFGWGFVNAANAVGAAVTSVADATLGPMGSALRSHPNPFAAGTSVEYDLARESVVQLRILDVSGRIVWATPAHSESAGPHEFLWDGTDGIGSRMAARVYLFKLRVNGASQTRKGVLLH